MAPDCVQLEQNPEVVSSFEKDTFAWLIFVQLLARGVRRRIEAPFEVMSTRDKSFFLFALPFALFEPKSRGNLFTVLQYHYFRNGLQFNRRQVQKADIVVIRFSVESERSSDSLGLYRPLASEIIQRFIEETFSLLIVFYYDPEREREC